MSSTPSSDGGVAPGPRVRIGCYVAARGAATALAKGFDFVEFAVPELCPEDPAEPEGLYDFVRRLPGRVEVLNRLFPPGLPLVGDGVDVGRIRDYVATVFRRVRRLGADMVVWGSGASRSLRPGDDAERAFAQLVAVGGLVARTAGEAGVDVVFEPQSHPTCNFVTTVAEGQAFVTAVGSPRLRLIADMMHMQLEGDPYDSLVPASRTLAYVHVPPGEPAEQYRAFLHDLKRGGYRGRIGVEPSTTDDDPSLALLAPLLREWWADS